MTMITPEQASANHAAHRLMKMQLSSASTSKDSNRFIEEKKSMDEAELKQSYLPQKEGGDTVMTNAATTTTTATTFRSMVSSEPGSKFLPEKGRYVLYVSLSCPNSHLALMTRTLKGLEDVITVQYVRPSSSPPKDSGNSLQRNWIISHEIPDDSLTSLKSDSTTDGDEFHTIREIYLQEDTINNTIPLLYDQEHQCIVNNHATDICTMFNSTFNDGGLAKNANVELFPTDSDTQSKEEQLKDWLYPLLQLEPSNLPPYHYNLSKQQVEFAIDNASLLLQKQRYLLGNTSLSMADLRLFAALVRYDTVYAKYFLPLDCPSHLLLQNRVLMDYCRDIYQQSGVAGTINLVEIQDHFLGTHTKDASRAGEAATLMTMLQGPHKRGSFSM